MGVFRSRKHIKFEKKEQQDFETILDWKTVFAQKEGEFCLKKESGNLVVSEKGIYFIVLDNMYSIFTGKSVDVSFVALY